MHTERSVPRTPHPALSTQHPSCHRLAILLIRPTRYDDDGYVVRHWRGTLPSNTLSCLNGLTSDAIASGALNPLAVEVYTFDEAVDLVDARRLTRKLRRRGTRIVVALAGVQTNQFPRARDLARQFKSQGCEVMIGGFHVSGSFAMARGVPTECQALMDEGVTIVLGEVEDRWTGLLQDAAAGRLRLLYDFLTDLPDLARRPLPKVSPRLQRRFAVRNYGTIDAGRGCPFNCSFCTIINVQGHAMRSRGAEAIIDHVRAHHHGGSARIRNYFFTDDNFSRNPHWAAIFDGLIALRRHENIAVDFMMQVDVAAPRIPRFVEKAAQAGCVQVFIGMESLREDNLRAAGKRQNQVAKYGEAIARWHEAGILCHVGFIIGFPHDTYERVMEDVRTLRDDLLVDQASFFMLTPLPGSRDHQVAVETGTAMDCDYNNFDSFRPTTAHPLMSAADWTAAYREAWASFYSVDHMRRALLRQNPHTYWGMLKCFLCDRASMVEGTHPMVTGFFRLKDRRSRRPGLPLEGRVRFRLRRMREVTGILFAYAKLLLEMQELWLTTRIRREDYAFAGDLRALRTSGAAGADVKTAWSRLHAALADGIRRPMGAADAPPISSGLRERLDVLSRALGDRVESLARSAGSSWQDLRLPALPPLRPTAWYGRLVARMNPMRPPSPRARQKLSVYWQETERRLRRWQIWRVNPVTLAWNAMRDIKNAVVFAIALASERF